MFHGSQNAAVPHGLPAVVRRTYVVHVDDVARARQLATLAFADACARLRADGDCEADTLRASGIVGPIRWTAEVRELEGRIELDARQELAREREVVFVALINGLVTIPVAAIWKALGERRATRRVEALAVHFEAALWRLTTNPYR